MPLVIIETANSESWPKVGEDKDLWIQGGAQFINAILLVKWNKRAHNTVAGYLEIHRQGGQQSPRVVGYARILATATYTNNYYLLF